MTYISSKQKISKFITGTIIPALETRDLDYNKTIEEIMSETMCSRNTAEGVLRLFRSKFKESHILTLSDERIKQIIDDKKKVDIEAELKAVDLI
jgi:iron only hydrogenase large subunit-like protein